ncbi:MAG: hypothetical protein M0Z62_03845 [Actinomycetota bacterium]|nr:hypothetical protein [Actinomycetota bacterium]
MTASKDRITREDIEARFRELAGEVDEEVASARSQLVTVGLAVAVAVVAIAYLAGRRRGRRRGAVIEIVRV